MSAFRQQITVMVNKQLSDEAQRQRLIEVAKEAITDAVASGKATKNYVRYVDGVEGASEEQARKEIFYKFGYAAEAAQFALDYLRRRTRGGSNKFANSFWISVDGRYIAPGSFSPRNVPPFAEIVIGNTRPENRKIDVGLVGTKKLSFSIPSGFYDDCASAVNREYSKVVWAVRKYDYNFPAKYHARKTARFQSPVLVITPY